MKSITMLLLTYFLTLLSVTGQVTVTDPNAQERKLSGFENIRVSDGIDLYLTQSETEAVAVSAREDKFRDNIVTKVENNTLIIQYKEDKVINFEINGNKKKLRAYVSFITLKSLTGSGASDIFVSGSIRVPELHLTLSGASDFKGSIIVNTLSVNCSGASDCNISGSAATTTIQNSGASDVKAYDLQTEFCTVSVSGASDVQISVSKELSATASGASDIVYKGDPALKKTSTSGASSITKKS